jgi:hypothetical protein
MRNVQVEILVEEPSMKNFLTGLLPQILPDGYVLNGNCFIRAHEGKQDLQKSIPHKVKAFQNFSKPTKLIVVQDKDSNDCLQLKNELVNLITSSGNLPYLVRIACQELESWYLGDMQAIESVYPKFKASKYAKLAKFRNPDFCNASDEIKQIVPEFQKGFASHEIIKHMNIIDNQSVSFNQFVKGLIRFLN